MKKLLYILVVEPDKLRLYYTSKPPPKATLVKCRYPKATYYYLLPPKLYTRKELNAALRLSRNYRPLSLPGHYHKITSSQWEKFLFSKSIAPLVPLLRKAHYLRDYYGNYYLKKSLILQLEEFFISLNREVELLLNEAENRINTLNAITGQSLKIIRPNNRISKYDQAVLPCPESVTLAQKIANQDLPPVPTDQVSVTSSTKNLPTRKYRFWWE